VSMVNCIYKLLGRKVKFNVEIQGVAKPSDGMTS
jgi:hypothetical protein